jgi:hypothetical protein
MWKALKQERRFVAEWNRQNSVEEELWKQRLTVEEELRQQLREAGIVPRA